MESPRVKVSQLPANSTSAAAPTPDAASSTRAAETQAHYEEYSRGFDAVPTLQDTVGPVPRRLIPPDFRRGERPDQRRNARPDYQSQRDDATMELEALYGEYAGGAPAPGKSKHSARKKASTGKRKQRRKR
jgi:hypothetical protein